MRIPRTGEASVDRTFREIQKVLSQDTTVCLTSYCGTKSAGFDLTLLKVKEPLTLTSIFIDVDTTQVVSASNYWYFQVAIYRPGFTEIFKAVPSAPYNDGTESFSTDKFGIVAHTGLTVPFDEDLKVGDTVVLEVTEIGTASDLVELFVQTDLTRAA